MKFERVGAVYASVDGRLVIEPHARRGVYALRYAQTGEEILIARMRLIARYVRSMAWFGE